MRDLKSYDSHTYWWPEGATRNSIFYSTDSTIVEGKPIEWTTNNKLIYCLVQDDDGAIKLRDEKNKKELLVVRNEKYSQEYRVRDFDFMFSKYKDYLAVWHKNGQCIKVYDMTSGRLRELRINGRLNGKIVMGAFSDDATRLTFYNDYLGSEKVSEVNICTPITYKKIRNGQKEAKVCLFKYADKSVRLKDIIDKKEQIVFTSQYGATAVFHRLSEDKKYVVVWKIGGMVKIYDVESKIKLVSQIMRKHFLVKDCQFSSENSYLLVNTIENTIEKDQIKHRVYIFDRKANEQCKTRLLQGLRSFSCSSDENYLLLVQDINNTNNTNNTSVLQVFDIASKRKIVGKRYTNKIKDFSFICNNRYLFVTFHEKQDSNWQEEMQILDLESNGEPVVIHEWFDQSMFSFDVIKSKGVYRYLMIVFADKTVKLFDLLAKSPDKEIAKNLANKKLCRVEAGTKYLSMVFDLPDGGIWKKEFIIMNLEDRLRSVAHDWTERDLNSIAVLKNRYALLRYKGGKIGLHDLKSNVFFKAILPDSVVQNICTSMSLSKDGRYLTTVFTYNNLYDVCKNELAVFDLENDGQIVVRREWTGEHISANNSNIIGNRYIMLVFPGKKVSLFDFIIDNTLSHDLLKQYKNSLKYIELSKDKKYLAIVYKSRGLLLEELLVLDMCNGGKIIHTHTQFAGEIELGRFFYIGDQARSLNFVSDRRVKTVDLLDLSNKLKKLQETPVINVPPQRQKQAFSTVPGPEYDPRKVVVEQITPKFVFLRAMGPKATDSSTKGNSKSLGGVVMLGKRKRKSENENSSLDTDLIAQSKKKRKIE